MTGGAQQACRTVKEIEKKGDTAKDMKKEQLGSEGSPQPLKHCPHYCRQYPLQGIVFNSPIYCTRFVQDDIGTE